MSADPTEAVRREIVSSNQAAKDLAVELGLDGPVWTTETLGRDFEVIGFAAPFVVVRRRSDGVKGTLEFVHRPRVYFSFQS